MKRFIPYLYRYRYGITIIIFLFLLFSGPAFAATGSLGSSIVMESPTSAWDFENSFSALARGINGTDANPAALMRMATLEASLGWGVKTTMPTVQKSYGVDDQDFGEVGEGDLPFTGGAYLTDDPNDISQIKTRSITAQLDYAHGGGMTNFSWGVRFGDYLAVGVSRRRPTAMEIGFDLYTPAFLKAGGNFYGQSFGDTSSGYLTIEATGKASLIIPNPVPTFETTAAPLWSEFLDQDNRVPVIADVDLSNDVLDKREIVLSAASKIGPVSFGIGIVPMTYNFTLNNTAVVKIKEGTSDWDMVVYMPSFEASDPSSLYDWVTDPGQKYAARDGYSEYRVRVPQGQKIYEAQLVGNYSATTVRADLGLLWEPNDHFSFAAALENFNSASLIYHGTGRVATIESWVDVGSSIPTPEVGQDIDYNPFLTTPQGEGDLHLAAQLEMKIPKILRIGFALKKPFVFALDYEKLIEEFEFGDARFLDLSFVKMGTETQIFFLPIIYRGDMTFLLKPTIAGLDTDAQQSIDDLFASVPIIPTKFNSNLGIILDGGGSPSSSGTTEASSGEVVAVPRARTEIGLGWGMNYFPLLSLSRLDLAAAMKTVYYSLYYNTGPWQATYTAVADPAYMINSNADNIHEDNGEITVDTVALQSTQTLAFTFRF